MENQSRETGEGYFSNRIRHYLIEHHPDLVKAENFHKKAEAYAQQAIQLFLAYDQAGMAAYEAMDRALVETLEGIRSPNGILTDFLMDHRKILVALYPKVEIEEPQVLQTILRENYRQLLAVMNAPTPEVAKRARQKLFQGVLKTLSETSPPTS